MTNKLDKKHWYDGWIYAKFIDTKPIPFRYKILNFINKNSTILDIGCGTGGFTMELAKHSKQVVGIDISKKQITQAKTRLKDSDLKNLEFRHINAIKISEEFNTQFDFAVFTFMLHEIDHKDRIALLNEVSKIAKFAIIMEFNIPHPLNIWGIIDRTIEFLAGKNHFRNFLDFKRRGGINNILEESGFHISEERINRKSVFKIVVANK
jgi:ubiquinone/menaquinone biosynthesis C-methylase UbiE